MAKQIQTQWSLILTPGGALFGTPPFSLFSAARPSDLLPLIAGGAPSAAWRRPGNVSTNHSSILPTGHLDRSSQGQNSDGGPDFQDWRISKSREPFQTFGNLVGLAWVWLGLSDPFPGGKTRLGAFNYPFPNPFSILNLTPGFFRNWPFWGKPGYFPQPKFFFRQARVKGLTPGQPQVDWVHLGGFSFTSWAILFAGNFSRLLCA